MNWKQITSIVGVAMAAFAAIINTGDPSITLFLLAIVSAINAVIHATNNSTSK